jgi:hypothetical protein
LCRRCHRFPYPGAGAPGELPAALLGLLSLQDQARRREALKQQMALAAQHLLAEPEKHVGPGLKLLGSCASDKWVLFGSLPPVAGA